MSLKVEMESEFPGPFFICSNIKVSVYKVFGLLPARINSGYLWDHILVCVHFGGHKKGTNQPREHKSSMLL